LNLHFLLSLPTTSTLALELVDATLIPAVKVVSATSNSKNKNHEKEIKT